MTFSMAMPAAFVTFFQQAEAKAVENVRRQKKLR
jgi:hypothetical protein